MQNGKRKARSRAAFASTFGLPDQSLRSFATPDRLSFRCASFYALLRCPIGRAILCPSALRPPAGVTSARVLPQSLPALCDSRPVSLIYLCYRGVTNLAMADLQPTSVARFTRWVFVLIFLQSPAFYCNVSDALALPRETNVLGRFRRAVLRAVFFGLCCVHLSDEAPPPPRPEAAHGQFRFFERMCSSGLQDLFNFNPLINSTLYLLMITSNSKP